MKKIFLLSALLYSFSAAIAQAPQMFNYQGVARNATGTALSYQNIAIKASILNVVSTTTVTVYSGVYPATTDALGLFTLQIGSVNPAQFAAINWASGTFFIEIKMDPAGGSNYTLVGTQQLLSVPFALYANEALKSANDSDYVIYTNSQERLRIKQGGQTVVNRNVAPALQDVFSVYGTGSANALNTLGDNAIAGYVFGAGIAVYGENLGNSNTSHGIAGLAGGVGNGAGVVGSNMSSNGTGIVGIGNGLTTGYTYNQGYSGSGIAGTGAGIGVYGIALDSIGNNNTAAGGFFTTKSGNYWAYVGCDLNGTTDEKIVGSGANSTLVKDANDHWRTMFSPEAPEVLFSDYGVGQLNNGTAHINIDSLLSRNIYVDGSHPIKIFIQPMGNCKGMYVENETRNGFDVVELNSGQSNARFSWQIIANRADRKDASGKTTSVFSTLRFPVGPEPPKTVEVKTGMGTTTTK